MGSIGLKIKEKIYTQSLELNVIRDKPIFSVERRGELDFVEV